jgi:hypothetical protein
VKVRIRKLSEGPKEKHTPKNCGLAGGEGIHIVSGSDSLLAVG